MTRYQDRKNGAREAAVWMFGMGCGVSTSVIADAAAIPAVPTLVFAGLVLAAAAGLRLLRPRRRAVVWEDHPGR